MVRELDDNDAITAVPACPRWTVRDVIAHLAGTCADILSGNIEGVTTQAWADAQVGERRHRPMAPLLEEWSRVAPPLEAAAERFPAPLPTLWVLDLTAHEHDVRGALGLPGARDTRALHMAVDFLVRKGLHPGLQGRGLGPLRVETADMSWIVGGEHDAACVDDGHGDAASFRLSISAAQPPLGTLRVGIYDLFRALTGRRSTHQISTFGWTTDPAPFVPAFQFGTFTMRAADLVE
jgi:uncharacterized protein (TIGR03083 family)